MSGYDWKDGIGDRDRRPPRKNPAWTGHRAQRLRHRRVHDLLPRADAEPYIAVNTGLGQRRRGGRRGAVRQRRPGRRRWAEARAENGHPEPFGVKCWGIGNEMYGDWQLGHMPLEEYVKKHNRVVGRRCARWTRRSSCRIRRPCGAVGDWSRQLLSTLGRPHDLISEHIYRQMASRRPVPTSRRLPTPSARSPTRTAPTGATPALKGKDIRVAARRVELLVRPATSTASWARGTSSRTGWASPRAPRDVPQQRRDLHGELRADGQRHRRDQDEQDGGRARFNRTRRS